MPDLLDFLFGKGALKKAAGATPPATAQPVTTPGVSQSDIAKMAQDQADKVQADKLKKVAPPAQPTTKQVSGALGKY